MKFENERRIRMGILKQDEIARAKNRMQSSQSQFMQQNMQPANAQKANQPQGGLLEPQEDERLITRNLN